MSGLSFIIPTCNAADRLEPCLDSLQADTPCAERFLPSPEILVSDGGSTDGTTRLARERGCRVLEGPPGRGLQLRKGAEAATGDWLFFLHADCRLPLKWQPAVTAFIREPDNGNRAGYGHLRFDSPARAARRVEWLANWRADRLGLPYGDQGLLVARTTYEALGGYRDMPLMEDVELIRRLGRQRLRPLGLQVITAADKYERDGWWKRPCLNLCRLALYRLGVSPARLARSYR